jgi:hypothetical protein
MGLQIITPPSIEPVTLADAKLWARINNSVEDSVTSGLITVAREMCEKFLRRPILPTGYLWTTDGFPGYVLPALRDPEFFNVVRETHDLIWRTPIGGVTSIDSINYIDPNTGPTLLAADLYQVDYTEEPCRLAPAYQQSWPTAQSQMGAVQIAFTAGYPPGPAVGSPPVANPLANVPAPILAALKVILTDMGENKGETNLQYQSYPVPYTADKLMWPYRVFPIRRG